MFIAFLVACSATSATAEEAGSWWWPFGGDDQTAQTTPDTPAAPQRTSQRAEKPHSPTASRTPLAHWPEVKVPKLWPSKSQTDEARNAWAKPGPEPEHASPWTVVTDGAHRVNTSTRNAWHKTVDVLNPFDEPKTPVAKTESKPSFWRNWFHVEKDQPKGPRTITEWMAQERLDP
jgi:hypothetical protein